jgi:lactoylglutathione lyase
MHIHHIAVWTHDLERLRAFYETYFQGKAGQMYTNPAREYHSYFLTFGSGASLELMTMPGIPATRNDPQAQFTGFIHLSFASGSVEAVNALTQRLEQDGYSVVGQPRWTGDGYYESVILDPDQNRVEIVA